MAFQHFEVNNLLLRITQTISNANAENAYYTLPTQCYIHLHTGKNGNRYDHVKALYLLNSMSIINMLELPATTDVFNEDNNSYVSVNTEWTTTTATVV